MASVADLLKKKGTEVVSVPADASIREALLLMAKEDIGALPILDGNTLSGIFSERDFARLLAKEGAFPLDTPVWDVMTKKLFTVNPDPAGYGREPDGRFDNHRRCCQSYHILSERFY